MSSVSWSPRSKHWTWATDRDPYQARESQWILSANSHRGPFGRKMGDMEHAGEANPGRQTPRPEFADRIHCDSHPGTGHQGDPCGGNEPS
jgi:hypothetical protein